jgi:hypothetical protein
MANALWPKTKAKLLRAQLDLQSVNMKAILLDQATYTYSAAHEFVSSLSGIVARSGLLTGKAVNMTTGAFDSDDPTAQAVSGSNIYRVALVIDTGSDATSPLVMFQDTGVTTVPFTPDGSDIRIVVDSTGWFIL